MDSSYRIKTPDYIFVCNTPFFKILIKVSILTTTATGGKGAGLAFLAAGFDGED